MKPARSQPVTGTSSVDPSHSTAPEESSGRFQHRRVRKSHSESVFLSPELRKQNQQQRALGKRKLNIQKNSAGFVGWVAKGAGKVLSSLISEFVKRGFKDQEQMLKKQVAGLEKQITDDRVTIGKKQSGLKKLEEEIKAERAKLTDSDSVKQWLKKLGEYQMGLMELNRFQGYLAEDQIYLTSRTAEYKKFQKRSPLLQEQLLNSLNSGLVLLTELRGAYQALKNPKSGAACGIKIPKLSFQDESGSDYEVTELNLAVSALRLDEHKNLIIEVPQCQADIHLGSGARDSVSAEAAFQVVIRPPLGKLAEKILSCNLTSIKGVLSEFTEQLDKVLAGKDSRMTDFIDVRLDDVSVGSMGEPMQYLLSHQVVDALSNLLYPVITRVRESAVRNQDQQELIRKTQLDGEYQQKVSELKGLEFLAAEVRSAKAELDDKSLDGKLEKPKWPDFEAGREAAIKGLKRVQGDLAKIRQARGSLNRSGGNNETGRATIANMSKLFFTARSIMDSKQGAAVHLDEQHVQIDEKTGVVLKDVGFQVDSISLSPEGQLSIKASGLNTRVELNHDGQSFAADNVSLGQVSIEIDPPLGQVFYEAANIDLPVTLSKLVDLSHTFTGSTSKHEQEGRVDPKRWTDYCHFNLVPQEEGEPEAGEMPFQSPLTVFLTEVTSLDSTACEQMNRALAIGLFGRKSVEEEIEPDEEGDVFVDSLEEPYEEEDEFFDSLTEPYQADVARQPEPQDKTETVETMPEPPVSSAVPDDEEFAQEALLSSIKENPPAAEEKTLLNKKEESLEEISMWQSKSLGTASFELEIKPRDLFRKMNFLERLLIGDTSIKVKAESTPGSEPFKLEFAKTEGLPSLSSLRQYLATRMIRKALKKRRVSLVRTSPTQVKLRER